MTSEIQNTNVKKVYDLEQRTALFGEIIIDFAILNTSRKEK
jgi:hypothetical protein